MIIIIVCMLSKFPAPLLRARGACEWVPIQLPAHVYNIVVTATTFVFKVCGEQDDGSSRLRQSTVPFWLGLALWLELGKLG